MGMSSMIGFSQVVGASSKMSATALPPSYTQPSKAMTWSLLDFAVPGYNSTYWASPPNLNATNTTATSRRRRGLLSGTEPAGPDLLSELLRSPSPGGVEFITVGPKGLSHYQGSSATVRRMLLSATTAPQGVQVSSQASGYQVTNQGLVADANLMPANQPASLQYQQFQQMLQDYKLNIDARRAANELDPP